MARYSQESTKGFSYDVAFEVVEGRVKGADGVWDFGVGEGWRLGEVALGVAPGCAKGFACLDELRWS